MAEARRVQKILGGEGEEMEDDGEGGVDDVFRYRGYPTGEPPEA